jgi:hypothetical protein
LTSAFFHQKIRYAPLIHTLNYFRIQIQIRRDNQIFRSFRVLSLYAETIFFVKLEQNKKLFLVTFASYRSSTLGFLNSVPLNIIKEKKFACNIQNNLRRLIRGSDEFFWPNQFKMKNLMQVYLKPYSWPAPEDM